MTQRKKAVILILLIGNDPANEMKESDTAMAKSNKAKVEATKSPLGGEATDANGDTAAKAALAKEVAAARKSVMVIETETFDPDTDDGQFDVALALDQFDTEFRAVLETRVETVGNVGHEIETLKDTIAHLRASAAYEVFDFMQIGLLPKPTFAADELDKGYDSSFINNWAANVIMPMVGKIWDGEHGVTASEKETWRVITKLSFLLDDNVDGLYDFDLNRYGDDEFDSDNVVKNGRITLENAGIAKDARQSDDNKVSDYSVANMVEAHDAEMTPDSSNGRKGPVEKSLDTLQTHYSGNVDGFVSEHILAMTRLVHGLMGAAIQRTDDNTKAKVGGGFENVKTSIENEVVPTTIATA